MTCFRCGVQGHFIRDCENFIKDCDCEDDCDCENENENADADFKQEIDSNRKGGDSNQYTTSPVLVVKLNLQNHWPSLKTTISWYFFLFLF